MDIKQKNNEHSGSQFGQDLVNRIAIEVIAEQRRARRWSIFFKLLTITYISIFMLAYFANSQSIPINTEKHTALIELHGVISAESPANADSVISGLHAAFKNKNTAGIIIRINSPGGSPVQAGYINDEIYRLREQHPSIPLYSVISDVCASGGYYVATAADKIYVDKASIVGSIGVIMSSFGFVDAIKKLGIERRLLQAGDNKSFLDPFLPLESHEVKHVDILLNNIHKQFIDVVKKGRGDKITISKEIFSGLIWTGEQSVELGLVDALGSANYVAREIIGTEKIVDFTKRENFFDRLVEQISTTLIQAMNNNTWGEFQIR